jgi:hypothetical protein
MFDRFSPHGHPVPVFFPKKVTGNFLPTSGAGDTAFPGGNKVSSHLFDIHPALHFSRDFRPFAPSA